MYSSISIIDEILAFTLNPYTSPSLLPLEKESKEKKNKRKSRTIPAVEASP